MWLSCAATVGSALFCHRRSSGLLNDPIPFSSSSSRNCVVTTGQPRGFGFVTFVDDESARRSMVDRPLLDGRYVEVKAAQQKPPMGAGGGAGGAPGGQQQQFGGGQQHQHQQQQYGGGGGGAPAAVPTTRTKKVFVGGLAQTLSERKRRALHLSRVAQRPRPAPRLETAFCPFALRLLTFAARSPPFSIPLRSVFGCYKSIKNQCLFASLSMRQTSNINNSSNNELS